MKTDLITGIASTSDIESITTDVHCGTPIKAGVIHSSKIAATSIEAVDLSPRFNGYVQTIAKICHEVNRVYCESIGDNSQVSWEDAPQWQKDSAVNGVMFNIKNPDATPEQNHENWVIEKIAEGWSYGPTKDAKSRTHPCLVPYSQLPKAQRTKDELFKAVIKGFAQ